MALTVYGLPHCDTVKKARAWLAAHGVTHAFHDFGKLGVPPDRLDAWLATPAAAKLLNRQGTTWRKLDAALQDGAARPDGARALMLAHPSLIKRPVVEWPDGAVTVGFDAASWSGRISR